MKANVLARRIRAYRRAMTTGSSPYGFHPTHEEAEVQQRFGALLKAAEAKLRSFLQSRTRGPWAKVGREIGL